MGDIGDRRNIQYFQAGIADRLTEDEPRLRPQGVAKSIEIALHRVRLLTCIPQSDRSMGRSTHRYPAAQVEVPIVMTSIALQCTGTCRKEFPAEEKWTG
jgi:hypothetical protein